MAYENDAAAIADRWNGRELLRLIAPLIAERLLVTLVGVIDTTMVSAVGDTAVSGVSLVDSVNFLFVDMFSALATGGAVVCSQYVGRGEDRNAAESAKQLLVSITLFSLALTAPSLIWHRQILALIYGGLDAGVMESASVYYAYSAVGYPFLAIYFAGTALFRSVGNSIYGMAISFVINIVHIIGNWYLIYVMNMGVAGVALSTLISRVISAVAIFWLLWRQSGGPIQIKHITKTRLEPRIIRSIMRVALPNGAEGMLFQVGKLFLARLVASFGTIAIAGNAVANIIITIGIIPGMSVSLAMLTIVGQCVGAGDYAAARRLTHRLVKINYVIMGAVNVAFILAMRHFLRLYNLSDESLDIAYVCGMCFCVGTLFIWTPAYCLPHALRASGDGKYAMIISGIAMWIPRVGGAYLLAALVGERIGVVCVWISMLCEWVVRSGFFTHRWLSGKWRYHKVIE